MIVASQLLVPIRRALSIRAAEDSDDNVGHQYPRPQLGITDIIVRRRRTSLNPDNSVEKLLPGGK
jgi:hypothetical protein